MFNIVDIRADYLRRSGTDIIGFGFGLMKVISNWKFFRQLNNNMRITFTLIISNLLKSIVHYFLCLQIYRFLTLKMI